MKYLFLLILLFGFVNLYSQNTSEIKNNLDSNLSINYDSTFFVKIKIVDEREGPLQYAYIQIVYLDDFANKIYIGDSDSNGVFSIQLSKKENYGYIYIVYAGYDTYILSVKDKHNIATTIKMTAQFTE